MLKFTITKEKRGYSAVAKTNNSFISTQGKNWEDLEKNIRDVVDLYYEDSQEVSSIVMNYQIPTYA